MKNLQIILFTIFCVYLFSCKESNIVIPDDEDVSKVISGKIFDKYFSRAAENIKVTLNPTGNYVYSDSSGFYEFKNLNRGVYELTTETEYFFSDTVVVDLFESDRIEANFQLTRIDTFYQKIKMRLFESYSNYEVIEEPKIYLYLETENIFGCYNNEIKTMNYFNGSNITIEYDRITLIGNICETAEGPAKTKMLFDVNQGNYVLQIKQKDIIDKYRIEINNELISIELLDSRLSSLALNEYWRYPKNSFAYLCGTTNETKWICEEFNDSLKSNIELTEITFPDGGEICYPRSSEGHFFDMPAKYYKYKSEEDFTKLNELLKEYSKEVINNYQGVSISIINWKNEKFLSWFF